MRTSKRAALVLAGALVLTGCRGGDEPTVEADEAPAATPPLVCHLTDEAELGTALGDVAADLDIRVRGLSSPAERDACDLLLLDTTAAPVTATGPAAVTLVGDAAGDTGLVRVDLTGALTAAGYLAAATTRTGTVGAWSTEAADEALVAAFLAGVAAHNDDHGTDVEVRAGGPVAGDDRVGQGDPDVVADMADRAREVVDDLLLDGADAIVGLAGLTADVTVDAILDAGAGRLVWIAVTEDGGPLAAPQDVDVLVTVRRDLRAIVRSVVADHLAGRPVEAVRATLGTGLVLDYGAEVDDDAREAVAAFVQGLSGQP